MLLTFAVSGHGPHVQYEEFGASVDLYTNGVSRLTDKIDQGAVTTWESALWELVDRGLLAACSDSGDVYEITRKGHEAAASQLRTERSPLGPTVDQSCTTSSTSSSICCRSAGKTRCIVAARLGCKSVAQAVDPWGMQAHRHAVCLPASLHALWL